MKKLAIIGCGGIGSYHLGHFKQFTDIVELAGFCDLIPERAENFVKEAGSAKAFTNYIEMYDEIQPDIRILFQKFRDDEGQDLQAALGRDAEAQAGVDDIRGAGIEIGADADDELTGKLFGRQEPLKA